MISLVWNSRFYLMYLQSVDKAHGPPESHTFDNSMLDSQRTNEEAPKQLKIRKEIEYRTRWVDNRSTLFSW